MTDEPEQTGRPLDELRQANAAEAAAADPDGYAEDELDACGSAGRLDIPEQNTPDDDVAALVLFADVDWTDEDAVAAREAEWAELLEAPA
ncbi:MAG: hypothetical protein ACF8PN_04895 [Phycisphaerales bacterium]